MKKLFPLFLLTFLFVSCKSTEPVYTLPKAKQKGLTWQVYKYPKDKVFKACLRVISSGTATIDYTDKSSGIITTDWVKRTGILSSRERLKMSMFVTAIDSAKTKVKINFKYQTKNGFGNWKKSKVRKNMVNNSATGKNIVLEKIGEELNSN